MPTARFPTNEASRLKALRNLGILDSPPDEEFDAIVEAASLMCGKPISLISLIDQERQFFKANFGLAGASETSREVAFCAYTILGDDILEVRDATTDARFADNPLVTGAPGIRFYAGMPLRLSDGNRVGTLCIIDSQPGHLNDLQRQVLRKLGRAAAAALEGWAARRQEWQRIEALAKDRERLANLVEGMAVATWEWHVPTGELRLNERWLQLVGRTLTDAEQLRASTHPDDLVRSNELMRQHLAGDLEQYRFEARVRHVDGRWVWILSSGAVVIRTEAGAPEWVFGWAKDVTERKEQEEALRKSQNFLRETGRLAGIGGWELDLASGAVNWTEETFRIHGLAPGAMPTLEQAISLYAPKARPLLQAAVERAIATGAPWDLELQLVRADGASIWVRANGSAVFAGEKPIRLIGAIQDVTTRVETRLMLKRLNERVALATECAGVGIWDWDIVSGMIAWDPMMYCLYGRANETEAASYTLWQDHLHPEDRQAAEAALWDCVNGVKPFDAEFRIIWADGSIHVIRAMARAVKDAEGIVACLIGVNLDVTEARNSAAEHDRQKARLAESETNFRLMAENATDMIARVGPDGSRLYVSPAAAAIFGVPPEKLIEQDPVTFMHPDDAKAIAAWQADLLAGTPASSRFTFRICHPEQGEVWAEVGAKTLPGAAPGEPGGYISVVRDVTERVKLEAERDEREAQLIIVNAELDRVAHHMAEAKNIAEQANRAKTRFLASMSHELRTPLNGILGNARLLRLEGGLQPEQVARVDNMLSAGSHLLEMIHCVLDMSEIETERVALQAEPVDLRTVANACLDIVRQIAQEKGVALNLAVAADVPVRVVADPVRLRQILLNLLGNAAKFTQRGGIDLRLRITAAGAGLRFDVADTGPGIPAEKQHRLFQDFTRLQSGDGRAAEGAGLGLALSSRLAALMGGRLSHMENPGGGSIFCLELPLLACEAAEACLVVAAPPGAAAKPREARKLHILVVDDSEMNLDIAASFMRILGHKVSCANGGAEAVAAVAAGCFDVVFMDVQMPDIDGLEATRQIRALQGAAGQVPVIAMTAQVFTEQLEECRQAGMSGHLAKPFTEAALYAKLAECVAGALPDRRSAAVAAIDLAAADTPVIDLDVFRTNTRLLKPTSVVSYLENIAASAGAVLSALRDWDGSGQIGGDVVKAAHKLAGNVGLFGFARAAEAARRFEHAARTGTPETRLLAESLATALHLSIQEADERAAAARGSDRPMLQDRFTP